MTKNSRYIALMLLALLAGSCAKEPIVLEFDDSYTPKKPTAGQHDALPPVDVYHTYLSVRESTIERPVVQIVDAEDNVMETTFDASEVPLKLYTSIPAKEDLPISIEVMSAENSPKDYASIMSGASILPEKAYTLQDKSVTISKGEREATTKIALHKEAIQALDASKSYILPIIYKGPEGKVFAVGHFTLKIAFQKQEKLPQGDNVTMGDAIAQGTKLMGEALSFQSDYVTNRLPLLNNGQTNDSWYVQGGSGHWLSVHFNTSKVVSLALSTNFSNKSFRSIKIEVSQDNGLTWVEQGTAETSEYHSISSIDFKVPVKANAVRMSEFVPISGSNSWGDITEIWVITSQN